MNMVKTIYISKEELEDFFNSSQSLVLGVAYEWEKEDVIHIHTSNIPHSFGKTYKVLFCKEKPNQNANEDYKYVIHVFKDDDVHSIVYQNNITSLEAVDVNHIPSKQELYSRNKGILEINILENKRVMIVGLGSFGSQIAIELAKAGVGNFSLFDFDRVELHNLARHTATVKDLGRLKTDVIEESIKGKNPYALVDKYPININEYLDLMESEVAKADLVICATDNNTSRFNLSTVLVHQKKIGIFGRAVTRAEGGDVFRYRPGGPCYCCLLGNQWFGQMDEEITSVERARQAGGDYMSVEDADAMVQVGLSADIEPICNMMVKISLMELSRGSDSGISCLEEELVYDYYMWANRRERRHANWAPMPGAGAKPTIMRWYGAHIPKNDNCSLCSNHDVKLDVGDEFIKEYGDVLHGVDMSGLTVEE